MSNARIVVSTESGGKPYDFLVGNNILKSIGPELRKINSSRLALIISDDLVSQHYLKPLKDSLNASGYKTASINVEQGEAGKSLHVASEIYDACANIGLKRSDLIISLGGGSIGDLGGFISSTYMRGVDHAIVPTTLLAMIDSAIGGKCAVNLDAGKNLVGTFKNPLLVCASVNTIDALDNRQYISGFAELIKASMLSCENMFFDLCDSADLLASRDYVALQHFIEQACVFKASIVSKDFLEQLGTRQCLNYGHTFAHALEKLGNYKMFTHGEAVAEGMRFAASLSVHFAGLDSAIEEDQNALLDRLGLYSLDYDFSPEEIISAMSLDKKSSSDMIRFILLEDIGKWSAYDFKSGELLSFLKG